MKLLVAILTGLFLVFSHPTSSQESESTVPAKTLNPAAYLPGEVFSFYMQAYGSQYFNDEWLPGDIVLENGRVAKNVLLRYNAYLDELIWLPDMNTNPVKIDKGMVHHFLFNSPETIRYPFAKIVLDGQGGSENHERYAQELYVGSVSLYAHRKVVKTSEYIESSGNTTYSKPVINPDTDYYIQKSDNSFRELRRMNVRSFSLLFPGNEKDVRRLLRRNNLRIKNEWELIEAVNLINQHFSGKE